MKIILIHGYKATPESNFFPWLRDELLKKGHEVIVPALPNSEAPDPEEWMQKLLDEVSLVDDETIVVGHSLGAPMMLRYLEAVEAQSTPKGCLLISPPWMINSDQLRGFFLSELDFDVLMWKASKFIVLHSKDDKVVPYDHAEKYAKVLHAKLIERNAGEGHFQGKKYPIILETINSLVNDKIVFEPGKDLENEYEDIEL